ncbi:MAG: hypothetical protein ACYDB7_08380 [Mycobacteriales bacterium]
MKSVTGKSVIAAGASLAADSHPVRRRDHGHHGHGCDPGHHSGDRSGDRSDQGKPTSSYRECQPTGSVPSSQVLGNAVRAISGGILLTDETGPTHGNLIEGNLVEDNAYDCGITLPSHNVILGNAMSGVTVHSHAPGEDLNGNVVTGLCRARRGANPHHRGGQPAR